MPREIVCDTVFGGKASLKTLDLAAINWCLAPIIGGWVIVCDTISRGTGPGAIVGRTPLRRKGVGGQVGESWGPWVETVRDTFFDGGRLLTTEGFAAMHWYQAPIIGAWDRVCETVFCGVEPGATVDSAVMKAECLGTTNLCQRLTGGGSVLVCDTAFCGVGLGAISSGTSLLGERRGLRAEIVCDTVLGGTDLGGEPLLKRRDLVANNWCLAPIIWGEGNCV
jgi:hypothetical protein